MKITKNKVAMKKVINELDKLVLKFTKILSQHTKYVIVSGYVAILFGRSRTTEDIDLLVPAMGYERFSLLFKNLKKQGFHCLNSDEPETLFNDYLLSGVAIRFALKGQAVPNIEFKFAKTPVDNLALKDALKVDINNKILMVSPIEQQIIFKKKELGSQKDFEDARHLEKVFEEQLNKKKLKYYEGLMK